MSMTKLSRIAGLLAAACVLAGPALAQANPPAAGRFGAEDGYGGDGFGWGPAYRPETTFRPSRGFYGGVERPYPYAQPQVGETTGSLGEATRIVPRRRATAARSLRRPTARLRAQLRTRPRS